MFDFLHSLKLLDKLISDTSATENELKLVFRAGLKTPSA